MRKNRKYKAAFQRLKFLNRSSVGQSDEDPAVGFGLDIFWFSVDLDRFFGYMNRFGFPGSGWSSKILVPF